MTLQDFSAFTSVYENSLDLSKRKENGIYYTDISLASKMIDELSIPTNSTVLDPCCGTGIFNFLLSKKNVLNVYGTDIDQTAIEYCKVNIPNANFYKLNSIEAESKITLSKLSIFEGVDYIVGNPPYAKWNSSKKSPSKFNKQVINSGNNLFIAGLIRAFDLLKPNGILSYIIPKNFLHVSSYKLLREEILKTKTILSIVDIGANFKNVRGEQIILTVRNSSPKANHKFEFKKLNDGKFVSQIKIPQLFFHNEILLFRNKTDFDIYNKLNSFDKLTKICKGYIGRGRSNSINAISGKEIRKFGFKNINTPVNGNQVFIQNIYSSESGIIGAYAGDLEASQTVTIITDSDSKTCRFILGILHSSICNFFLYRYCYNYSRLTMHTDAKYLQKIPIPEISEDLIQKTFEKVLEIEKAEYMSENWFINMKDLNTLMYKAYKLTMKEQEYIEAEMRIIQSKKWQK